MHTDPTSSSDRLRSRCNHLEGSAMLGVAELRATHVRITGWSWRGRVKRVIALPMIVEAAWISAPPGQPNLFFDLIDGTSLALRVQGAALWKFTLDARRAGRRIEASRPAAPAYRHRVVYDGQASASEQTAPVAAGQEPGGDAAPVDLSSVAPAVGARTPRS